MLLIFPDTDLDDRLSETVADANGTFRISGHQAEMVWISPYLKLEHNCGGPDNTGPMEKVSSMHQLCLFKFIISEMSVCGVHGTTAPEEIGIRAPSRLLYQYCHGRN